MVNDGVKGHAPKERQEQEQQHEGQQRAQLPSQQHEVEEQEDQEEDQQPVFKVLVMEGTAGYRTASPVVLRTSPAPSPELDALAPDPTLDASELIEPAPLWLESDDNDCSSWIDYPKEWWQALESPSSEGPDPELESHYSAVSSTPATAAVGATPEKEVTYSTETTTRPLSSTKKRQKRKNRANGPTTAIPTAIQLSGQPPGLQDIVLAADPARHAAAFKAHPGTQALRDRISRDLVQRLLRIRTVAQRQALIRQEVVDPMVKANPHMRFVREVLQAPLSRATMPKEDPCSKERDVSDPPVSAAADDADAGTNTSHQAESAAAKVTQEEKATPFVMNTVQWKNLSLYQATAAIEELVEHLIEFDSEFSDLLTPPPLVLSGSNEVRVAKLSKLKKNDVSQAVGIINVPPFVGSRRKRGLGGTDSATADPADSAAFIRSLFQSLAENPVLGGHHPPSSVESLAPIEQPSAPVRVTPVSPFGEEPMVVDKKEETAPITALEPSLSVSLDDHQSLVNYAAASHSTLDPSDLVDLDRTLSGLSIFHADDGGSLSAVENLLDERIKAVDGNYFGGEIPESSGTANVLDQADSEVASGPSGFGRSVGLSIQSSASAARRWRSGSDDASCGSQRWQGDDSWPTRFSN